MFSFRKKVEPRKITEAQIENTVKLYAKVKGFYVRKFVSPSNQSVPDDIFISPEGVVFFIEFKAPGKKMTDRQTYECSLIKKNKINNYVIDSVVDGKLLIDIY